MDYVILYIINNLFKVQCVHPRFNNFHFVTPQLLSIVVMDKYHVMEEAPMDVPMQTLASQKVYFSCVSPFKHHILLFQELCVPQCVTSQLLLCVHMGKFCVRMEPQEMAAPLAPPVCLQDLLAPLFIPVS